MLRLQWINAYTVVAMDTTERIHLLSVKTDSEIEVSSMSTWHAIIYYTNGLYIPKLFCCLCVQVLDLKQVELVYSSSFFKSIETGGNVSRALVSTY